MLISVDYGRFGWVKFFKMLSQDLSLRIHILPRPDITFQFGSIYISAYLGSAFPSKMLYYNKYSFDITYHFFGVHTSWWAYDKTQDTRVCMNDLVSKLENIIPGIESYFGHTEALLNPKQDVIDVKIELDFGKFNAPLLKRVDIVNKLFENSKDHSEYNVDSSINGYRNVTIRKTYNDEFLRNTN